MIDYGLLSISGSVYATTIASGGVVWTSAGAQEFGDDLKSDAYESLVNGAVDTDATLEKDSDIHVYPGSALVTPFIEAGAQVEYAAIRYAPDATSSFDPATDKLTITEGGVSTTLQLSGDYTGESFVLQRDYAVWALGQTADGTLVTVVPTASLTTPVQGVNTIFGAGGNSTINGGTGTLYFGKSDGTVFNATGSSATLVGGGSESVNANAARMLVFGGTGLLTYNGGAAASTVVSGSGGAAVIGGSASLLYFGNGRTTYTPGAAVDTVLGFTGSLTATGGTYGTLFFTGTAGNSQVSTGSGATTIVGQGANDSLIATGAMRDVIEASGAATTIDGSQALGANVYFVFGTGDVVKGGWQSTIESYLGNQTLVGGVGATLFEIVDSGANRALTIGNFVAPQDHIKLQGYAAGEATAAVQNENVAGGNTVLTLSDGTHITLLGVAGLSPSAFV